MSSNTLNQSPGPPGPNISPGNPAMFSPQGQHKSQTNDAQHPPTFAQSAKLPPTGAFAQQPQPPSFYPNGDTNVSTIVTNI